MSNFVSLIGWAFLPNLVTGWVQNLYYSVTIRAGDPRPMPGQPRWAEHRRRIHILVVTLYLAYTIYEADYDLRRAGSFYTDLGVSPGASDRDIKSRFRRLAALHHPDKAGASAHNNAYFSHLKTAADVLADPVRRFAYDRFGPDSVAWAAPPHRCASIYDHVALGVRQTVPVHYGAAAAALLVLGHLLGMLGRWGRHERWLVLAGVLVFELHALTRPHHPWLLTAVVNPALARLSPRHPPYLPFQAVALARRLSLTSYLGFSQLGPLLGADTSRGTVDTSASDGDAASNGAAADTALLLPALADLEKTARGLDTDATRLVEMELAPFAGHPDVMVGLRARIKEWLIQNTIRSDPLVRDALGRSLQRRRPDAPVGARGTR